MTVVRLDLASSVRLGATPIEVRPDGYRVYRGVATYGDVVLEYPEFGRNEFRPASEVLSPEAVASMRGVPFTLHHPDDLLDAEDPESIRRHQVGTVLAAEADLAADPPALVVEVIVHSRPAQEHIESGELAELSPGYRCEDEPAPPGAAHGGKPYAVVQRRHQNNHLSGVLAARTVLPDGRRARLDEMRAADTAYPPKENATMTTAALAAALTADTSVTRTDAAADPAIVLAKFSPADAEILKTLSPEGLMMLAEMGAAVAGEVAEEMAAGGDVEIDDAAAGKPAGVVTMDMVTAAIDAAMAKMGGKKTDGANAGQPNAGAPGRIDPDALIRAATEEARRSVRRDAAIVDAVRRDGHDVHGYDGAVTTMLAVVEQHAPKLIARAREDLKSGRMDAVVAAYETAEDIRRAAAVDAQSGLLRHVLDHEDGQRQPVADTFRMPTRGGAV